MKISGFTFVRNAIQFDYPVVEAIRSILPLCDDMYVAVGKSDDDTLALIQSIDPEIHILETVWDDSLRKGGEVLAIETNKALKMIPPDTTWCFYLQADEVVHEKYYAPIREAMHAWKDHEEVDGLLFNYLHFYGTYDYIASSTQWYRREIRIIKNDPSIYSYKDAQGFRKGANQKLKVKPINAWIHHYGWVKHPRTQLLKTRNFDSLYDDNAGQPAEQVPVEEYDYGNIDQLERFKGSHPEVMFERLKRANWHLDHDPKRIKTPWKHRFKYFVEKHFGFIPWEYRNYRII